MNWVQRFWVGVVALASACMYFANLGWFGKTAELAGGAIATVLVAVALYVVGRVIYLADKESNEPDPAPAPETEDWGPEPPPGPGRPVDVDAPAKAVKQELEVHAQNDNVVPFRRRA